MSMKFKGLIIIAAVSVLVSITGCRDTQNVTTTTDPQGTTTTTITYTDVTTTTLDEGNKTTTVNNPSQTTAHGGSDTTTTTTKIGVLTTIKDTSELTMHEISVSGLPAIVGDSRNRLRISAAGVLNGNVQNPMYLLVTNVGEDDIYSATISATAGGKEISFNISYLPKGSSVWAESVDYYRYNADDKFVLNTGSVIVSATSAGVSIERNYSGALKIYAGERNGGKGLFVENVSGQKIKKIVVKYRPISSNAGLYSAPSELVLTDFDKDSKAFKANSYLHDVDVVDVQITY